MDRGRAPQHTPEQWNQFLYDLAGRMGSREADLLYCLDNKLYDVEQKDVTTSFSVMLFQYDVSAGKAYVSGAPNDALAVMEGLMLTSRNFTLPESEWSMSAIGLNDKVQALSMIALYLNGLDEMLGEGAAQSVLYQLAYDVCAAAMEYSYLSALYAQPAMAQKDREELYAALCAQYGVAPQEHYLATSSDVLAGNAACVSRMLGGLTAIQVAMLEGQDGNAAQASVEAMLAVYNVGNPIAEGYKSGLPNAFDANGVEMAAQYLMGK